MRTIIAERKRPRTDNEQTISPELAYARGRKATTRACTRQARVDLKTPLPGGYHWLHDTFQPLSPFAGSSVSFLVEFFTITTSPTIEPS